MPISRTCPWMLRQFGPVAAGFPSPAQGYEDEPLDLHQLLVPRPAATFFYRARGNELLREGIRDGALLVVDRSVSPAPGRLVVADQDGVRTVCRLPQVLTGDFQVWGVVTAIIMKV